MRVRAARDRQYEAMTSTFPFYTHAWARLPCPFAKRKKGTKKERKVRKEPTLGLRDNLLASGSALLMDLRASDAASELCLSPSKRRRTTVSTPLRAEDRQPEKETTSAPLDKKKSG